MMIIIMYISGYDEESLKNIGMFWKLKMDLLVQVGQHSPGDVLLSHVSDGHGTVSHFTRF